MTSNSRSKTALAAVAVALIAAQFLSLLPLGLPWIGRDDASAEAPGDPAFERVWARTDKPVAEGQIGRTWMWGPEPFTGLLRESYAESPGGARTAQYFDKSRMEITDPAGDPNATWFVTNGLLVVELVSGRVQVGDNAFLEGEPAQVNVAGDPDDLFGPTYATFGALRALPALADGAPITQRVDRAGLVTDDPSLAAHGVTAAERVTVPGIDHQVASPFWAFMNSGGLVWENDAYVNAPLFENPFYATGLPIADAYWASVKLGGIYTDVLMQCFERRCLTYTPLNAPEWRVEAGNVGQHYFAWRSAQTDATPTATATATSGTDATATVTNTPTATATLQAGCDPSYPDFCIPSPPPELDCGDIIRTNFTVLSPDPHNLDPDNDGVGCEAATATATATKTPAIQPTATKTPASQPTATKTPTPPSTATKTPTTQPTATKTPTTAPTATNTPTSGGNQAACLNAQEAAFLTLINDYRQQKGLNPLTASRKLSIASYNHSLDMGQRSYFAHDTKLPLPAGQSGPKFTDRIKDAGYGSYTDAGENIAAGSTYSTAAAVFNAWKNSSGHNANMLSPNFTQIGIGLANVPGSTYGSYWTTDFANGNDGPPC